MKIRGTPSHIAEKYLALARDAHSSGDPVLAENYLQHAEHYIRIIMAYREQFNQPGDAVNGNAQRMRGPSDPIEGGEDFGDEDGEDALDEAFPQQHQQPVHQQRHQGPHEGNRHERPYRRDQGRFRDRDRPDRDRPDRDRQHEGRPQVPERQQEHAAEGGGEPRRRERFPQQAHEQPDFLRRPVKRVRSENDEPTTPGKDEPSRD